MRFIKEHLNYDKEAFCDIDPSLLLDPKCYIKLLNKHYLKKNYLFTYILDNNIEKEKVAQSVKHFFDKELYEFNTNAENPSKPLKERVAPKVEAWLSGIYYSDFVITDSFHGCVFSIIFNKPFLVYVNKKRGADRFVSILSLLGLDDRMIYNTAEFNEDILKKEIDWDAINYILENKRVEIRKRLSVIVNKDK